jgi:tetratricopeptide (TPR) repeat protein
MPAPRRGDFQCLGKTEEEEMKHSDDLAHLAECAACRQRFTGNVVTFDASARRNREEEFTTTAARLERERNTSPDVVARYLRDTPLDEWPRLAEMPELRNNAALEQMSEEVRRRLHRKPREALAIANLTASIAESLHPSQYPAVVLAQLKANAWKDRASTLRYLARYDEAIEAAERGEEALAPFASLEHDRAIVRMVKGMALAQLELFDEAHAILSECRRIFRDHGDIKRSVHAGRAEASTLYQASRHTESHALLQELLQDAIAEGDLESQAGIYNNLGYCSTQLGDFKAANIHFSEAVAKFTDLGFAAEVARTERGAGLVLVARGQTTSGLTRLRDALRAFRAAGMVEDAGLCALNVAEVLLERGNRAEARSLTQNVIDEFTTARMNERAIAAVVGLRDAIDVDDATSETVHTVHAFVESLRHEFHDATS